MALIMIRLTQIHIFPIKSTAGISLDEAVVEERGLKFDRRLMLVDVNGRFVTARQYPKLSKIQSDLVDSGLVVNVPEMSRLTFNYNEFCHEIETSIWREQVLVLSAPVYVNQWFSKYIDLEVSLCYLDPAHSRYREAIDTNVSFADGYPLLLIGQQSLEKLNNLASEPTQMSQFRTNLVIAGAAAFAEDQWQRIKIGDIEFELAKPCERCIMTTIEPSSGEFRPSKEPLATLATFRADDKGRLMFGENLIARNYGKISVGDRVEILSVKKSANYSIKKQ
jgi:MOSC domain-containing protein